MGGRVGEEGVGGMEEVVRGFRVRLLREGWERWVD